MHRIDWEIDNCDSTHCMRNPETSRFLYAAGIAAIFTALTTVGIHYIDFPGSTIDQRASLAHHTGYILHRWMIIFHCVGVMVSMTGIFLWRTARHPMLMLTGLVFYIVFGIMEISRMMAVLHFLNPLRESYLHTNDPAEKLMIIQSISQFQLLANTLFAVVIFAFVVGNFCYGLSLIKTTHLSRWIGIGFLFWAFVGAVGILNGYMHIDSIDYCIEIHAKIFQPLFRLCIGIWLITLSNQSLGNNLVSQSVK